MPPDSKPQYFPVGVFSKYPELSEWDARWYASELRQLREPSLLEGKNRRGYSVYRLLIPPFSPCLAIRLVVNPDGAGMLTAKLGTSRRGEDENAPREQAALAVSSEQVNEFLNLLHEVDFWSLPTEKSGRGWDGEEWLLEGKRNVKYHVVDRWTGAMEATYSRACNYLQELSPLKVERQRRRNTSQESAPTPD